MSKFFVNDNQISDKYISIIDDDVNHIKNVLRLKIDDEIKICSSDTSKNYLCKIKTFDKKSVECEIIEELEAISESNIEIESATIGKVINMGIKDINNIGAVMAPAAASVIVSHLEELKRDADYYDLILTGDLGEVGSNILKEYLEQTYNIKLKNHMDAGMNIYNKELVT